MVDFRAFSILDAIMAETPSPGTNPYNAGVYFSGSEFITDQFVQTFNELFADERLTIFITISAKPEASLLIMRHAYVDFSLNDLRHSYVFFTVQNGQFIRLQTLPIHPITTYNIIGSSVSPSVLVMTDQNGDFRYVTFNTTTLQLESTSVQPSVRYPLEDQYQFFGSHIDFIGQDAQTTYRMTVNSSNVISLTALKVEPQRTQPIYISHGHNKPVLSGHLYLGHLLSLGDISTRVERTETSFGGVATPSAGVIKVSLADGYFDYAVKQSWDTRTVEVLAGLTTQPTDTYEVILRANTEYAEWDEDELSIVLKDHSVLFDRDVQINTYLGTGGFEGTPDIKGNIKPLCYGLVEHAEPVLLSAELNLYQFHDGPSDPGIVIREGGAVRTSGGVFTSNILNWVPTPDDVRFGIIRIDFNRGVMRLAAPPAMPITFEKHGTTEVSRLATASEIVSALIRRAAPEMSLDANSFDFHKTIRGEPHGLYIREPISLGDAIREITAATSDVVSVSRLNVAKINTLNRRPPRAFITQRDIVIDSKIRRMRPPKPGNIYRLAYGKTWNVLDESQLLGVIDSVSRDRVQEEYRWNEFVVEARHSPSQKHFDSAKTAQLSTSLILPHNDMIVEIALRDHANRDLYEITVMGFSFAFDIADSVLLQLDRWDITSPKNMIIVGITEMSPTFSTEDQTKLLLWG